jgi:hypothetical protein
MRSLAFARWQRVGARAIVALLCVGGSACELVAGIENLTLDDASVPPRAPPAASVGLIATMLAR